MDCLLDFAGCAGNAHVILQNMAVHFQPELKVRRYLIAAKQNTGNMERLLLPGISHTASTLPRYHFQMISNDFKVHNALYSIAYNMVL
jgi:hypothetical protein